MKIDKEKALAGIVAVVALVAIICELVFGGISTASIAGAVKDIAGITVDISVFLLAFRAFAKKEDTTFRGKLESAMEVGYKKYTSIIVAVSRSYKNSDGFEKWYEFYENE